MLLPCTNDASILKRDDTADTRNHSIQKSDERKRPASLISTSCDTSVADHDQRYVQAGSLGFSRY